MERKWVDNLVFAHGERETRQNKETEKQARIVHFKGELGVAVCNASELNRGQLFSVGFCQPWYATTYSQCNTHCLCAVGKR